MFNSKKGIAGNAWPWLVASVLIIFIMLSLIAYSWVYSTKVISGKGGNQNLNQDGDFEYFLSDQHEYFVFMNYRITENKLTKEVVYEILEPYRKLFLDGKLKSENGKKNYNLSQIYEFKSEENKDYVNSLLKEVGSSLEKEEMNFQRLAGTASSVFDSGCDFYFFIFPFGYLYNHKTIQEGKPVFSIRKQDFTSEVFGDLSEIPRYNFYYEGYSFEVGFEIENKCNPYEKND